MAKKLAALLLATAPLQGPASAAVVYVDASPTSVQEIAQTEGGAVKLNQILNDGFDSGGKFVQVPRHEGPAEHAPRLATPDTIDELFVEVQSNIDDYDTDLAPIPYALGRILQQGRDHIGYGKLEDRKAGLFTAVPEDGGGTVNRIRINAQLKDLAAHGVGRWALGSVLVHEGRHQMQEEAGTRNDDRVKSEVEAFTAQYKYLIRRRDELYAAARASIGGDPRAMKFYSHLLEIVEYGDQHRLEDMVRKNYRPDELQ